MAASQREKALRIGVIQNGVLVDEHLFRRPQRVTIGESLKNTVVALDSGLPGSFELMGFERGSFCLSFNSEMSGRLSKGGSVHTLEALRSSGSKARRDGRFTFPLSQAVRGKLEIGEVTLLFHFVTPPPVRPQPKLPMGLRAGFGGFIQNATQLTGTFGLVLVASFLLQVGFVVYLVAAVPPPPRPAAVSDIPDQVRMFLTEMREEPEPTLETPVDQVVAAETAESAIDRSQEEEEQEDETRATGDDREDRAERPAADATPPSEADRLAMARSDVRESAFFGALTTSEDGTVDPIAQVSNLTDRDVAHVMGRVRRDGESRLARAELSGYDEDPGGSTVVTPDVGRSAFAARSDDVEVDDREDDRVRVEPRIRTRPLEPSRPLPSEYQAYLSDAIRSRTRHLEDCYAQTLRSNPSAGGRVVLQIAIGTNGRVSEIRLTHNEIGEQFEGCVELRVRRWRFEPPDETLRVSKAYSLEPGQ